MSDVNKTLRDLMEQRLREMGYRHGERISLHAAYRHMVKDVEDRKAADPTDQSPKPPSYEIFRRILNAGHTNIQDDTASALANLLHVPVARVYAAASIRPPLGRFELPRRADRLDPKQRQAVLGVVDAILEAAEQPAEAEATPSIQLAARRSRTKQSNRAAGQRQDDAATSPDPEGPEHGA